MGYLLLWKKLDATNIPWVLHSPYPEALPEVTAQILKTQERSTPAICLPFDMDGDHPKQTMINKQYLVIWKPRDDEECGWSLYNPYPVSSIETILMLQAIGRVSGSVAILVDIEDVMARLL